MADSVPRLPPSSPEAPRTSVRARPTEPLDLGARQAAIGDGIVGRRQELESILAVVAAGRDLLLEGPPGTSKSTILRAITAHWGIPLLLVEGNAELTPAKLIGHHNPARVLREDYSPDNFVPGPLTAALQQGGFLYIEEFNRVPEDTLNALLTAMAERELNIPRVGRVVASPTFRLVAAMNPFDTIGTGRISVSIYDRLCRLAVDYQSVEEEAAIVRLRAASADEALVAAAVALTRATRQHPEVRLGASVRGAIDLVLIAAQLRALRGADGESGLAPLVLDAGLLALSGRITLAETSDRTPESIIRELWENLFILGARQARGDRRLDPNLDFAVSRPQTTRGARLEPLARRPRPLEAAPTLFQPGDIGSPVMAVRAVPSTAERTTHSSSPPSVAGPTAEEGSLGPVAEVRDLTATSAEAREVARRIARRLSVRRPRERAADIGSGRLASVPYRYNSDDIDLDRTMEVLAERPVPEDTDIIVRERVPTRQAVVLLVDVSGSMRGDKTTVAAATVGALMGSLAPSDELAVVAFWQDAALVQAIGTRRPAEAVLDDLVSIPTRGLTNIAFALEVAGRQLQRTGARRRLVLLLSDGVHNAGPDPRELALRLPRLHVLLETAGEHDRALATELARLGRGQLADVATYRDVAPALNRMFAR